MKQFLFICILIVTLVSCQKTSTPIDNVHYIETSDSCRLYVHVKGIGPTCLYLHGGPGSGSEWMKALVGPVLEKRFTMVYLDQRGVCKSSIPTNDNYSFDRQIRDWEEVRKALGIKEWLLMGHSWGGILMMGYWKKHSEVIDGMIFLNSTLSCGTSMKESWLPTAIEIVGDKANPIATDTTRTIKERLMAIFPQLNDNNRWKLFTPNKWANDTIGSWTFHKECIAHDGEKALFIDDYWEDFRPLTQKVNVPVLYLYGTQDYAVGPGHYKGLNFPKSIIRGADCGHIIFLEEPTLFANSLDEYLEHLSKFSN